MNPTSDGRTDLRRTDPAPPASLEPQSAATMNGDPMDQAAILAARLRLGAAYELKVFDRLSEPEQQLFSTLSEEPGFYGVLRPTAPGPASFKSVDRDTALLLWTLSQPGPLPFFAREEIGSVAAMVLDGVLEGEHEGSWLSGAAAAPLFAAPARRAAEHPLARLSHDALWFAAASGEADPSRLAARLYGFNREPLAPRWEARLEGPEDVLAFLGFEKGGAARRWLASRWTIDDGGGERGWIYFARRGSRRGSARSGYKLYLSARLAELPRAVAALIDALEPAGGHFKVGTDAAGLLRPDKLVAYFDALDPLLAAARALEAALDGCAAQGVPFTAPIDPAGLLSWGVDPPAEPHPLPWQGPESWRTWLVGRLATALAAAAGQGDPAAARDFALARLELEGVEVERWVPSAALWKAA